MVAEYTFERELSASDLHEVGPTGHRGEDATSAKAGPEEGMTEQQEVAWRESLPRAAGRGELADALAGRDASAGFNACADDEPRGEAESLCGSSSAESPPGSGEDQAPNGTAMEVDGQKRQDCTPASQVPVS
jgi:hypothetical protein